MVCCSSAWLNSYPPLSQRIEPAALTLLLPGSSKSAHPEPPNWSVSAGHNIPYDFFCRSSSMVLWSVGPDWHISTSTTRYRIQIQASGVQKQDPNADMQAGGLTTKSGLEWNLKTGPKIQNPNWDTTNETKTWQWREDRSVPRSWCETGVRDQSFFSFFFCTIFAFWSVGFAANFDMFICWGWMQISLLSDDPIATMHLHVHNMRRMKFSDWAYDLALWLEGDVVWVVEKATPACCFLFFFFYVSSLGFHLLI